MHRHEQCVQCGSRDLLRVPATPGNHSHIVVGDRLLRSIQVDKYVCTDCGRIEEWVNDKDDLRKLKAYLRAAGLVGD
jgi:DNA-directed RNA polymerase subunit RPC12/RpoP